MFLAHSSARQLEPTQQKNNNDNKTRAKTIGVLPLWGLDPNNNSDGPQILSRERQNKALVPLGGGQWHFSFHRRENGSPERAAEVRSC